MSFRILRFEMSQMSNKDRNIANKITVKPFLKWAGGKRQLLEKFGEIYPEELKNSGIDNYYEPFVGGGAVFFDIIQKYNIKKAFLFDINVELILIYKVIREDVDGVIDYLSQYEQIYLPLDSNDRKEFYYDIRETFNRDRFDINYKKYSNNWIPRAAQAIFLNKTCYNGLFRFNNGGGFNTPSGIYKNPKICDKANLKGASELLQIAEIKCATFKTVGENITKRSFVYFDPPYRPISKTSNFTSYSRYSFTDKDQRELATLYRKLDKNGCKLMLSNSDPQNTNSKDTFFEEIYQGYTIKKIPARRAINSKATGRGAINEIIVTNY